MWSNTTGCQIYFSKIPGPTPSSDRKQKALTHANNRQNHTLRLIMKRFLA